ncbi:MAG: RluA family pseudouridine synthase [Haliscomenobacter sp.]|nr:RluA family pseudouridine synthase [Haliscomenobacter sp.]MBK8879925.1 RluA family pseudouridine synthase [Haliscomenobacter sp.]
MRLQNILLAETSSWFAVNKPSGISVERQPGASDTLEDLALNYAGGKKGIWIVHRLDRPTSGVVLMAKKKGALTNIQEQFRNGKVQKIYLARTQHKPDQDQGALRHWLVKDQKAKTARALSHPETSAQEALLRYHIVSCQESGWLWRIELLSGRFHQIRAQLSAIGCPVIGDTLYGGLSLPGYPGIALHALELHFYDPNTGEPVTVRAPQPESPAWPLVP